MSDRFYVGTNKLGCFVVCDSNRDYFPEIPNQRYGYASVQYCQEWVDALNAGRETVESYQRFLNAGTGFVGRI